ncbi:class I histocompatibility antigen, F10 alpha chain-like [Gopherus evgoodei]|uniref:Class I histocompatibility antigen, F10 alpha chain-like n=1 Tax=Gopherus evgoodei TaxID=1825980 RepID=A0A8C4YT01_9SAUR|nr:class I histocompatibility antigen, F10 alpha chain-like [Gopherus evgoodei]
MALGVALGLCWGVLGAAVADDFHSWDVLVTGTSREDGSYWFFMIGKLDDFKMMDYSMDTQVVKPSGEWMAEAVGEKYFQDKTQDFLHYEKSAKVVTDRWTQLYNQTSGDARPHMIQVYVSCSLDGDTPLGEKFQYAYDGDDFISFDAQTGTWVAAVQPAFIQKQLWDTHQDWSRFVQWYLQTECLETVRSLVQVGMGTLEQQAPPEVSVSHRDTPDGSVTLSCHTRGFYPRPIHVSWVRDGEDILAETDSSGILPNADGTYYTQSSLEISPQQDRHRYACRVEHSSLGEPTLIWASGKKGPLPPAVLAAIVLAILVLAGAVGAGVVLWRRNSAGPVKPGYALATTKSREDSASSSSSGTDSQSLGPQC